MAFDPKIWGPHYWFVLHTIGLNYPLYPNETIKKKYYDFIENLPLFIPQKNIGNMFSKMLDDYPVTPYLDSRESFIKWLHFIHNKVNLSIGIPEKSLEQTLTNYYKLYESTDIKIKNSIFKRKKYLYLFLILLLTLITIILYKI